MIKLVAALGNPGMEYKKTRHNAGWLVLEKLSFYNQLVWQKKFKGEYATYSIGGEKIIFLKPETFMNKSGESLLPAIQFFKLKPDEILIVHDEIELDFGLFEIKKGGGLAGHNGLRSIVNAGIKDFWRLRFGIGRPLKGDVSSFVLGKFIKDEENSLDIYLRHAAELLEKKLGF